MIRNRIDLSQVCQRYKARIIKMVPYEDYFLVETNRGTKELREWPNVELMRWSFQWREQMARNGVRNVERFIRTRDAKPYVITSQMGYTLTDHMKPAASLLSDGEHMEQRGQIVAHMHTAQRVHQLPVATELFYREKERLLQETTQARQFFEEARNRLAGADKRKKWALAQCPPVLQRMDRCARMLSELRLTDEILAVSHRSFGKENWGVQNEKLYLRGFYRPRLSIQHRDTAQYLRQLQTEHGTGEIVHDFLNGYIKVRPISYPEYSLVLVFLAYPNDLWKKIQTFLEQSDGEGTEQMEAQARTLEEALVKQQQLDPLLQQIAERAESGG